MKRERDSSNDNDTPVWSTPTRRAFVGMLGAAAATLALRVERPEPRERPAKPLWIGHC